MKIEVISDLHGSLINIEEDFDILLICGDICPVYCHKRSFQWEWLNDEFVEWVNNLPYTDENSKVVCIAGNHDFKLESLSKKKIDEWVSKMNGRFIYLDNEMATVNGLKIFGCPYCKPLPNWAFVRDNLEKYYDFIPDDLDILITHDAPDYMGIGTTTEGKNAGTNYGNNILGEYVIKRKPKYHFCGHIHTGTHGMFEYKGIKMANVSILNENYDIAYKPLIIKI